MAPKLKKLTLMAVTEFLKDRIEYVFNIVQLIAVLAPQLGAAAGNVDQQPDLIIKATLKPCIENDLLRFISKFEFKGSAPEDTDDPLQVYLNDFVKGSSTDLSWSLDKHFEEIKCDMSIVFTRSHIIDLMTQWTEINTRYNLEKSLQPKKGMKAWREVLVKNFSQQLSEKT
jgi:hypothetical protein